MPQITIVVHNGEVVRKGMENLRGDIPRISRLRIYQHMMNIVRKMKIYPPARPDSTYVRTYTLQKSWKVSQAGALGYRVEADPVQRGRHYGKYVVGDAYGKQQAWMHYRWQLFRNVADEEIKKMPKSIQDDIGLAIKHRGLG